VSGRHEADLGGDRTQVGDATTVDAHALVDHPLADDLLGERLDGVLDLALATLERIAQRLDDGGDGGLVGRVALGLVDDLVGGGQAVLAGLLDGGEHVVAVIGTRLERHRVLGARGLDELELELDRLTDPGLGLLEAVGDDVLGDERRAVVVVVERLLGATGLDHHDGDVVTSGPTGDHDLEGRLVALLVGRVRDPGAVLAERQADGADGALERQAAQHEGGRRAVDGRHVVGVHEVGAEDGADDLGLVAVALGEARPQGAVDEPAGQHRGVGRTGLPAEERAGDLPGGVGPLLDVDRQREEVDALAGGLLTVGRDEDGGLAELHDDGALRLRGELARLEGEHLVGGPRNRAGNGNGVSHAHSLSVCAAPATS
jgi:hypothetical protein